MCRGFRIILKFILEKLFLFSSGKIEAKKNVHLKTRKIEQQRENQNTGNFVGQFQSD